MIKEVIDLDTSTWNERKSQECLARLDVMKAILDTPETDQMTDEQIIKLRADKHEAQTILNLYARAFRFPERSVFEPRV
ncbi:MAG: hypothetical protein JWO54_746 [Candidatus Saccharibacteria bacterium]|jgi:hypothetical protein|nr:hypothetical protein [Candidatus Saccharibacteria bacterium]